MRDVKTKFRIKDYKSCVLIGVLDPFDCLQEGEIFVQLCPEVQYDQRRDSTFYK